VTRACGRLQPQSEPNGPWTRRHGGATRLGTAVPCARWRASRRVGQHRAFDARLAVAADPARHATQQVGDQTLAGPLVGHCEAGVMRSRLPLEAGIESQHRSLKQVRLPRAGMPPIAWLERHWVPACAGTTCGAVRTVLDQLLPHALGRNTRAGKSSLCAWHAVVKRAAGRPECGVGTTSAAIIPTNGRSTVNLKPRSSAANPAF
jgi:hypothetical protein